MDGWTDEWTDDTTVGTVSTEAFRWESDKPPGWF